MKGINKWFRTNFGYSRKEINGTIVLFAVVFLCFTFSFVLDRWLYDRQKLPGEEEIAELDRWIASIEWQKADLTPETSPALRLQLTSGFDPNDVSREELLAMNLPERVADNWTKYLAKGGSFSKTGDLLRIYGMDSSVYQQLRAFVRIAEPEKPQARPASPAEETIIAVSDIRFDINKATAEDLQRVRGIGPVFSERIVKFRDRLGGFFSKEQLSAVYGIKPETLEQLWQEFELDTTKCCSKRDLNTIPLDSLRLHPYLSYNQAKAIVAYREMHGPFQNWQDVKEVRIVSDSLVQKLKYYFEL